MFAGSPKGSTGLIELEILLGEELEKSLEIMLPNIDKRI
jgi:hypothetical protein